MTATQHRAALDAAVAVFRDLGWVGARPEDAATLPMGTAAQQRTALAGLRSGEWSGDDPDDPRGLRWVSWIGPDIDAGMLTVFTIRAGVTAQRAVERVSRQHGVSPTALAAVVRARGEGFVREFTERALAHGIRGVGRHGLMILILRFVHEQGFSVPEDAGYLELWTTCAYWATREGAAGADESADPDPSLEAAPLTLEMIGARFTEHLRVAVATRFPPNVWLREVIVAGLERDWIEASEARELVFAGLDGAQRPGDRKAWAEILTGPLELTSPEQRALLLDHADALVSSIATGDAALIEAFGPPLILHANEEVLADVLRLSLEARTKKARRAILAAATARPVPSAELVAEFGPTLADFAAGTDAPLARTAAALLQAWGGSAETRPAAETAPVARGRWEPTPPLWTVPRFELGEPSAAALTAAAAALSGLPESSLSDPAAERLLALANLVARRGPEAARVALRGVRPQWVPGLRGVAEWVAGLPIPMLDRPPREDIPESGATIYGPVPARDAAVLQRLGSVPALLSTPTWIDLRVDPGELVAGLRDYAAEGAAASEADLYLAMLRLDLTLITPELAAELAELEVPVLRQDGSTQPTPAGPAVLRYAEAPLQEPDRELDTQRHWWTPGLLTIPPPLSEFPPRLRAETFFGGLSLDACPNGGDTAGYGIEASDIAGLGRDLRVLVTRSRPLTPGLAINLLATQRGFHERAAVDGVQAVREAWERGILVPGVADPALLDWRETPSKLAAFATACGELADEGMLSVVWPLLDAFASTSVTAPRRLAGTAELVEMIGEFIPAVAAAVSTGLADANALDLPGTRALAAAGGNSRAVVLARRILTALPPEQSSSSSAECDDAQELNAAAPQLNMSDEEFFAAWPPDRGNEPVVDDGAAVTARWHDESAATRFLEIGLTFPAEKLADPTRGPREFLTRTSWFYDLEREGQCGMTEGLDSAVDHAARSWLRWDPAAAEGAGAIVVAEHRNWVENTNGPLRNPSAPSPLTAGMVAVLLGSMNHDNAHAFTVREAVRSGLFGAASVRLATRRLLGNADYTPTRLVGLIESDPDTLPTLWPILTESVRIASAETGTPPRWLNRVLDVALRNARILREAANRAVLPDEDAGWPGLRELAERKGTQAALRKARELRIALGHAGALREVRE